MSIRRRVLTARGWVQAFHFKGVKAFRERYSYDRSMRAAIPKGYTVQKKLRGGFNLIPIMVPKPETAPISRKGVFWWKVDYSKKKGSHIITRIRKWAGQKWSEKFGHGARDKGFDLSVRLVVGTGAHPSIDVFERAILKYLLENWGGGEKGGLGIYLASRELGRSEESGMEGGDAVGDLELLNFGSPLPLSYRRALARSLSRAGFTVSA